MNNIRRLLTVILATSFLALSACSKLPFGNNPASQGENNNQPANSIAPGTSLSGNWSMAFSFNEQITKCHMQLHQRGTSFEGKGHEEGSHREFIVSEGSINGADIQFIKRYAGAPADAPPVQYIGKVESVNDKDFQGLYMKGEYATMYQGQEVHGSWEGELPNSPVAAQTPAPSIPVDPNKAPELSGKWKVSFQYNFKTINSTMFIEQDGSKLLGHGLDVNTNEKFDIESGWYKFPNISMTRKYTKGKDAASTRTMVFKGKVSNVADAQYQGALMKGETQGGGSWEAKQVK
jgi:hypothetical protein